MGTNYDVFMATDHVNDAVESMNNIAALWEQCLEMYSNGDISVGQLNACLKVISWPEGALRKKISEFNQMNAERYNEDPNKAEIIRRKMVKHNNGQLKMVAMLSEYANG